jgi:hypothetical protein
MRAKKRSKNMKVDGIQYYLKIWQAGHSLVPFHQNST